MMSDGEASAFVGENPQFRVLSVGEPTEVREAWQQRLDENQGLIDLSRSLFEQGDGRVVSAYSDFYDLVIDTMYSGNSGRQENEFGLTVDRILQVLQVSQNNSM